MSNPIREGTSKKGGIRPDPPKSPRPPAPKPTNPQGLRPASEGCLEYHLDSPLPRMTLLQHYAGLAMQGIMAANPILENREPLNYGNEGHREAIARTSFQMAQAMIEAEAKLRGEADGSD